MICARCNRKIITAAVTLAGTPFGPRCAQKMGLMALVQKDVKTHPRAIKRVTNRDLKCQLVDGQIQLFEGMAA